MKSMMRKMQKPALEIVNFELVNKVPTLYGLKECRENLMAGVLNVWYEYVPKSYDGRKEVPLIMQIHGGGHDGKRWSNLTIWHEIAEKEGFIVVYPNSPEYGCWPCEEEDINYLYDLIQLLCNKYRIDRKRIYMQGMSNGDMMTLAFSMRYPNVLAAAGYMTGPSADEILDGDRPCGPLPVLQMRGELDVNWNLTPDTVDVYENRYSINDLNREIWEKTNGCENKTPLLSIQGKDNFLYYEGKHAPIINWEVKDMGHREPVYGAQVLWDRLYSGCSREGDNIRCQNTSIPIKGDSDMVIIAAGSSKAYKSGDIITFHSLIPGVVRIVLPEEIKHFCPVKLNEMCETEVVCVPIEFFEKVYNATLTFDDALDSAELEFENRTKIILYADSLLLNRNGTYMAMQKPCIVRCGIFYVPVVEFCRIVLNKQISEADDVLCITDHYAELGRYTARIMRNILGGIMRPRTR